MLSDSELGLPVYYQVFTGLLVFINSKTEILSTSWLGLIWDYDLKGSLHNLSRESVSQSLKFLALYSAISTVEYLLEVILSFYHFKKVCFLTENGILGF